MSDENPNQGGGQPPETDSGTGKDGQPEPSGNAGGSRDEDLRAEVDRLREEVSHLRQVNNYGGQQPRQGAQPAGGQGAPPPPGNPQQNAQPQQQPQQQQRGGGGVIDVDKEEIRERLEKHGINTEDPKSKQYSTGIVETVAEIIDERVGPRVQQTERYVQHTQQQQNQKAYREFVDELAQSEGVQQGTYAYDALEKRVQEAIQNFMAQTRRQPNSQADIDWVRKEARRLFRQSGSENQSGQPTGSASKGTASDADPQGAEARDRQRQQKQAEAQAENILKHSSYGRRAMNRNG